MIIKRKIFGLFDMFKKNNDQPSFSNNVKWDGKVNINPITFKEMENEGYYPSLVFMGLNMENYRPNENNYINEWENLNKNLSNKGLFVGNNYKLMAARRLSDNINGNNGLTCYYVKFTPDTKIDSGVRLNWGNKIKWTEDFINNYHNWYKSGKY